MRVVPVVLLLVLLAPGCVKTPLSCDQLDARAPSRSAPLVASLQGAPDEVAARIAGAAGDALLGNGTPILQGIDRAWETRDGLLEMQLLDGRFGAAILWQRDAWASMDESAARGDFAGFASALGLHDAGLRVDARAEPGRLDLDARQEFQGDEIWLRGPGYSHAGAGLWVNADDSAAGGMRSQLNVRRVFDLRNASVRVSLDDAKPVALKATQCRLAEADAKSARVGVPLEGFVVENESLGWSIPVAYGEGCDGLRMRNVAVDVETGAILDVGPEGAGCVY